MSTNKNKNKIIFLKLQWLVVNKKTYFIFNFVGFNIIQRISKKKTRQYLQNSRQVSYQYGVVNITDIFNFLKNCDKVVLFEVKDK